MIEIVRTFDADYVQSVMTHPKIYPHISDDGSQAVQEFNAHALVENENILFLKAQYHIPVGSIFNAAGDTEPMGVFVVHPHNHITYEIHTCVLPSWWGPYALVAGRKVIQYVFQHTPCQKLITHVPEDNRAALAYAKRCGLVQEGINRKSFLKNGKRLDQILLGISKE